MNTEASPQSGADTRYYPTLEQFLFDELGQSELPTEQRVFLRAIEMALDNGEFDGSFPSREQWADLGGSRFVYLEQARAEIANG